MLTDFTQVSVSEASAQRLTEAIGLAYEAVKLAEVERIERDWPVVPSGPDKLVLSVDGAFVPLVHRDWSEVTTLVVAEVGHPTVGDDTTVVLTHSHSSFSRVAEEQPRDQSCHRPGTCTSKTLTGIQNGTGACRRPSRRFQRPIALMRDGAAGAPAARPPAAA
jgi:hypothetical protein